MSRVFFYVQHLLGMGHLIRSARIARALAEAGFSVDLVSGGVPVPALEVGQARLVQLPPVKAGPDGFAALVHPDGSPFTQEERLDRAALLRAHFDRAAPDILMTEAFPFGRRPMRFELLPLLDHARAQARRPLVVASVRDILQRSSRPGRDAEFADLALRAYDCVLVHGDEGFVPFAAHFPQASRIAHLVRHTGLVGPGGIAPSPERFDVVVSAGGGIVGETLLRAALAARPLSRLATGRWLFVTGPNAPAGLEDMADAGVIVRRFVPDLPAMLAAAGLSVSQAGYNTVADLMAAGVRAVLVPYAAGGETEQTARAEAMQALGMARVVAETDLSAPRLAAAIDAALADPPPRRFPLEGAPRTAAILSEELARFRSIGGSAIRPAAP